MNNNIILSIVIPFYNVEEYFRECLDSIVNQTLKNIEIILVNDCSQDHSKSIALEYAANDNRVKYIEHKINKGLGGGKKYWYIKCHR